MPYDPSLPLPNSPLESQVIRDQLQALFNLINNIVTLTASQVDGVSTLNPGEPATVNLSVVGNTLHFSFGIPRGSDGANGAAGPPFAQAVVDGVTTVNPWDPATVGVSFDGANVHFTFGIPRGNDGSNGSDGQPGAPGTGVSNAMVDSVSTVDPTQPASAGVTFDTGSQVLHFTFAIPRGNDGATGPPGPQGPVFGNAVVDGVSTLNPGEPATAQAWFDGSTVHFTFGLPRGNDGVQGPPGEVSAAQLASAIGGTSSNSNGVATLDTAFTNDPPTLADMELMRAKMNELILALRR